MGPPWVQLHPQAVFPEFLVLDFGFTEAFAQSWEHFRTEVCQGTKKKSLDGKPPEANIDDSQLGSQDATAAAKAKAKAKAGGKLGDKGATATKAKADKSIKQTLNIEGLDNSGLWREGNKLKLRFQQAMSAFAEVQDKIHKDEAWQMYKGQKIHVELLASQEAIKSKMSPFHKTYVMTSDVGHIKKAHNTATCEIELANFLKLSELVDTLQATATKVIKSQRELSSDN
jgi:hypothetical protein